MTVLLNARGVDANRPALADGQFYVATDSKRLFHGSVPNRIAVQAAQVDLTAQSAAKAATILLTPAVTGLYRISAYLKVTTAASTSSTLGALTITYTDGTDSVAQSLVCALSTQLGASASTVTTNTTAAKLCGDVVIYAKAGVPIQYAIAYTSSGSAMQYEAHLSIDVIERSTDYELIKSLCIHPSIFPHICDDFTSDPRKWEPSRNEQVVYLIAKDREGAFGFGIFVPSNWVCYAAHVGFLPRSYGPQALGHFKAMIAWMWVHTKACRLNGEVCRENRRAIRFAMRAGFVPYGINPKSKLRGGILVDQVCLGLSKTSPPTVNSLNFSGCEKSPIK